MNDQMIAISEKFRKK